MRRDKQLAVIDRLLATIARDDSRSDFDAASATIDVTRYTSAERLAAERRVLFRTLPIVVGRATDLAEPGSYLTHDATGVPILVTRGPDGEVRAMLNVCRHRGTRLVEGPSGHAKAFVCRYHAWTYDLAGCLGHVPLERSFPNLDRPSSALVSLPCAVRHGFVWVVPNAASRIDVASWLADFDDDLECFGLSDHVVFQRRVGVRATNWKLVMDAFLEGYHVKSLHQRTLARFFLEDVVTDRSGPHIRSVGARKNLPELRGTAPSTWDFRATTTPFYAIFPNNILVLHPETISHIALYPKALGEVEYVHTMLAPRAPANDAERAGWQKTWELIDQRVFAEEDLAIAESVQSVLHSGANTSFQLGALEQAIKWFHDETDRVIDRG